jgi:hypothetical protein
VLIDHTPWDPPAPDFISSPRTLPLGASARAGTRLSAGRFALQPWRRLPGLEVVYREVEKSDFVLKVHRLCRGAGSRMGIAISTAGEGLREAARYFGGAALRCLRLPSVYAGAAK